MMRYAALALALLAGACAHTNGRDYAAPEPLAGASAPLLASTPAARAAGAPGSGRGLDETPPPDAWWQLYRDARLDALVADALAANTDLRVADANLARVAALLRETRTLRTPSTDVSAGASYGRSRTGGSGPAVEGDSYDAGLDLNYEVDLFGRVRRLIEAARADVAAAEAARDAVTTTVVAETVLAYSDACSAGERLVSARRTVTVQENSARLTRQLLEFGRGTRLDVARATSEVEQSRANIPPIEAERTSALARLSVLAGRPPFERSAPLAACARTPLLALSLPVGDGVGLLRRRADIRQAERELAANTARIGVATAELYPTITLGGGVGTLAGSPGGLVDGDAFNFSLGPFLSWRFPNTSVARARIAQAEAEAAASLARFDGAVLGALEQTQGALAGLVRERERLLALDRARTSAADAARLSDARFRGGADNFLTLLDAQRELADTEFAAADSRARVARAQVELFRALGGGWETRATTRLAGAGAAVLP